MTTRLDTRPFATLEAELAVLRQLRADDPHPDDPTSPLVDWIGKPVRLLVAWRVPSGSVAGVQPVFQPIREVRK